METPKIENPREKIQIITPDKAMMIPQNIEERIREETHGIDKNPITTNNKQHNTYITQMSGLC